MKAEVYSLPFDQFQRYFDLNRCLEALKQKAKVKSLNLLDVGGYPGLIFDFLTNDNVTVLDVKPLDKPNYVRGDACSMPFKDGSFNVVTALDVFEHIVPEKRELFLEELERVAKDYIILGGPFSSDEVNLAEKIVFEFATKVLGEDFASNHPLKEHLDNGLPRASFLAEKIKEKGHEFVAFDSGQLYNWLLMNLVKHFIFTIPESESLHKMLDNFYNQHLSPKDYGVPSYRTFFVISKNRDNQVLEAIKAPQKPKEGLSETLYKLQLLHLYFTLFELEAKRELQVQKKYSIHLESLIGQKENLINQKELDLRELQVGLQKMQAELGHKEKHLHDLQTHADNLETSLNRIRQTFPYKLYKTVSRNKKQEQKSK